MLITHQRRDVAGVYVYHNTGCTAEEGVMGFGSCFVLPQVAAAEKLSSDEISTGFSINTF